MSTVTSSASDDSDLFKSVETSSECELSECELNESSTIDSSSESYTDTSLSSQTNTCKYCACDVDEQFRPCACKMPIHRACLDAWLRASPRTHCEVCNTQYNLHVAGRRFALPKWVCSREEIIVWLFANKYRLMIVLLYILPPFIGDNFSNLYAYTYTNGCRINLWAPIPNLLTYGITGYILLFTLMFIMVGIPFKFCQVFLPLTTKRNIAIYVSEVLIIHIASYIAGNIIAEHAVLDTFACAETQLDHERLIWLRPINISLVTWTIGGYALLYTFMIIILIALLITMVYVMAVGCRRCVRCIAGCSCCMRDVIEIDEYAA